MKTYIVLKGVKFYAYHGVAPQERIVGNNYEVNVKIGYPIAEAMETDRLEFTLNYAEVYEKIKMEMDIPSRLLEHVAARIVNRLKSVYPDISSLELQLSKCNPPIVGDVEAASVIVSLQYEQ